MGPGLLYTLRPRQDGRHCAEVFSNAFSWEKICVFWRRVHSSFFISIQLTKQTTNHYLNQWWLIVSPIKHTAFKVYAKYFLVTTFTFHTKWFTRTITICYSLWNWNFNALRCNFEIYPRFWNSTLLRINPKHFCYGQHPVQTLIRATILGQLLLTCINFYHGCTIEDWEWISNFITHFIRHCS